MFKDDFHGLKLKWMVEANEVNLYKMSSGSRGSRKDPAVSVWDIFTSTLVQIYRPSADVYDSGNRWRAECPHYLNSPLQHFDCLIWKRWRVVHRRPAVVRFLISLRPMNPSAYLCLLSALLRLFFLGVRSPVFLSVTSCLFNHDSNYRWSGSFKSSCFHKFLCDIFIYFIRLHII